MLAPIRDYLRPQDPQSSPLLCATRDRYFNRLSIYIDPGMAGFEEGRWIVSEDVNIEHLLDVFTSIDPDGGDSWHASFYFMRHLYWHKSRQTTLGSKIEALPDDHDFKPRCLFELEQLFGKAGNFAEQKRLLTHTLELERRRGDDPRIAQTLQYLSGVNRHLCLHKEGIQQVEEALEIHKRISHGKGQTRCLDELAWLFFDDEQLDAAENAATLAIDLAAETGQEFIACNLQRLLGGIHQSKGEKEKAVHRFETALGIAAPFHWHDQLFWINYSLVQIFVAEKEFDKANTYIEKAKSHAVADEYLLGRATEMQAGVWYLQSRLEDAKSEALHAFEIYEKLGASGDAEDCRDLLREIEQAMKNRASGLRGELLETSRPTFVNLYFLV